MNKINEFLLQLEKSPFLIFMTQKNIELLEAANKLDYKKIEILKNKIIKFVNESCDDVILELQTLEKNK